MNGFMLGAILSYGLVALVGLIFFGIYFFKSEFMPYHKDAVEKSWGDIDKKFQILILAFMRAIAGGWLTASISIVFLVAIPFQDGELWSIIAIPIIGLVMTLSTLYASLYVKRNTDAKPPIGLVILAIVLLGFGFILSLFSISL